MSFQILSNLLQDQLGGNDRLLAISGQSYPAHDPQSDINSRSDSSHTVVSTHRLTGLLTMLCPVELSNAAFITSAALLLGTPHPLRDHTRDYANFDVFGDCLRNNPTHAAHSRTQSHDHIISILADLASRQGIPTSIKHVPFADSQTQRRADLVTCRGGLVRKTRV